MSITKAQTVQYPSVVSVAFTYADLTTAVVEVLAQVPAGATVIGGEVIVDTAWTTTGTATIKVGDTIDDDEYTASAVNLKAAARTALTLTGYKYAETTNFIATPALADTAADAGAARINIMYVVAGRGHEVQG